LRGKYPIKRFLVCSDLFLSRLEEFLGVLLAPRHVDQLREANLEHSTPLAIVIHFL
jgi:hypothetical protein